jgi:hypothetical protein
MKYDLLLTGGEVIDPGVGLRGVMDVGIAAGKIVAVAPSLKGNEAHRTISAKGRRRQRRHRGVRLLDGNFDLRDSDSDGNTVTAKRRLLPQLTLKDGRVWYERTAK